MCVLSRRWATKIFSNKCRARETTHPATLEMLDRIGLYRRLRTARHRCAGVSLLGRHEGRLIAAFDHGVLKNDTRFPYVLQCERIKIVEEALAMAKAHPNIELRLATESSRSHRMATA